MTSSNRSSLQLSLDSKALPNVINIANDLNDIAKHIKKILTHSFSDQITKVTNKKIDYQFILLIKNLLITDKESGQNPTSLLCKNSSVSMLLVKQRFVKDWEEALANVHRRESWEEKKLRTDFLRLITTLQITYEFESAIELFKNQLLHPKTGAWQRGIVEAKAIIREERARINKMVVELDNAFERISLRQAFINKLFHRVNHFITDIDKQFPVFASAKDATNELNQCVLRKKLALKEFAEERQAILKRQENILSKQESVNTQEITTLEEEVAAHNQRIIDFKKDYQEQIDFIKERLQLFAQDTKHIHEQLAVEKKRLLAKLNGIDNEQEETNKTKIKKILQKYVDQLKQAKITLQAVREANLASIVGTNSGDDHPDLVQNLVACIDDFAQPLFELSEQAPAEVGRQIYALQMVRYNVKEKINYERIAITEKHIEETTYWMQWIERRQVAIEKMRAMFNINNNLDVVALKQELNTSCDTELIETMDSILLNSDNDELKDISLASLQLTQLKQNIDQYKNNAITISSAIENARNKLLFAQFLPLMFLNGVF